MKNKMRECICIKLMPRLEVVYVHLLGCPKDSYTKEYDQFPWFKKLFNKAPSKFYSEHFK